MKMTRSKSFRMQGERGSSLDLARGRIVIVSALFVLAYVVVAARVFDLSVIQGEMSRISSETGIQISQSQEEPGENSLRRADIVDRNGVLLARSLKTASLFADPKLVLEPESLAKKLVHIFPDMKYGDVLKKLQSPGRFVWVKRNLTPEEHQQVLYLGNPGLGFESEDQRLYPQGALSAHLVGYTSVDGVGIAGVEASFQNYLSKGGKPLQLSLDVRLQHIVRRELERAKNKFSAKGGVGIVMDVRNGEVLASVSYPDYDPHTLGQASDYQKFNRASLGTYEIGSVLKVFSVAGYLDTQNNPLRKSFDAREPMKRPRMRPIRDYHPQKRILSLPEVFVHSSNIGTALMAEEMGTKTLKEFYKSIGLVGKPELEIPEVAQSAFVSPWQEVDTLSASFGHAIAVSPLQVAMATSSIVNGGLKIQPTIIYNPDLNSNNLTKLDRVVSPDTAHRMRQLMRLNVTHGSGKSADVKGLMVGGKTGTAEKPGPGGYSRDRLLSSFVAVFPMDDPAYVIFVMLDEPKGIKETHGFATAGWTAAPVAGKIITHMATLYGLTADGDKNDVALSLQKYVKTEEQIKAERAYAQSH